ncbi:MAG: TetR/AcrR family transcriptional regulator [Pseudomonadota bacterium]|nr:TetR/AcrR family transcriptional regulator [Pseudomonadota bacterium]
MPRPQGTKRKQQIIEATVECIIKHGYYNFSMQDVADAADVSKGIIHYYFLNKDELMMAVLDRCAADIEAILVKRIIAAKDPLQRLKVFISVCFDVLRHNREYYQVNMDFWTQINQKQEVRTAIAEHYRMIRNAGIKVIEDGIKAKVFKSVDVNMYASLIVSIVDGFSLQYLFDNDAFDYDKITTVASEWIISGLLSDNCEQTNAHQA